MAGPQVWLPGPQAWLDGPDGGMDGRTNKRTDYGKSPHSTGLLTNKEKQGKGTADHLMPLGYLFEAPLIEARDLISFKTNVQTDGG